MELANRSRYLRADFFGTPDDLSEPRQIARSVLVARGLAGMLGVKAGAVPRIPLVSGKVCPVPPASSPADEVEIAQAD